MCHRQALAPPPPGRTHRDKCYSLQDALLNCQFRFQDLPCASEPGPDPDPGTGTAGPTPSGACVTHTTTWGLSPYTCPTSSLNPSPSPALGPGPGLNPNSSLNPSLDPSPGPALDQGPNPLLPPPPPPASTSAPLCYRLSHEVRSMHHPRYMRPLYNRGGDNFDVTAA